MQNSRIYTNLFAFLHIYLQSSFFDNCRLLGMTELRKYLRYFCGTSDIRHVIMHLLIYRSRPCLKQKAPAVNDSLNSQPIKHVITITLLWYGNLEIVLMIIRFAVAKP